MNKEVLKQFWEFVTEREAIRLRRKAKQPWPWTKNEVLRDYHWPNAHRRDDTGTQWILKHLKTVPQVPIDLLFTVYVYRSLNRLSTFESYGFPSRRNPQRWISALEDARAQGVAIGSDRHMTFFKKVAQLIPSVAKMEDLAELVFNSVDGVEAAKYLCLARINAGPFTATQIIGDLAEHGACRFNRGTLVPVSGGSRIGLGYIGGTVSQKTIMEEVAKSDVMAKKRREHLVKGQKSSFQGHGWFRKIRVFSGGDGFWEGERELFMKLHATPMARKMKMTFIDLEHCLCELARYNRAIAGQGFPSKRIHHE